MGLTLLLIVLSEVLPGQDKGLPDGLCLDLPGVELLDGFLNDLHHLLNGYLHLDAPVGLVRSLDPLFLQELDVVLEAALS